VNNTSPSQSSWGRLSFDWVGLPIIILLTLCVGLLPMTWQQQMFFGALTIAITVLIARFVAGPVAKMVLVLLSLAATARYAIWRIDSLWHYLFAPWSQVNALDSFFMLLLLAAELYSFLILYLGFMQTIAPLRRAPVPLPDNVDAWPTVDILIPTFNEPLDVVRYTILAAKQQDWPADKFTIHVLDDGNRADFRAFAAEAGVNYIARPLNEHAKAGNINYALARTSGDLVAIFDCDHIPTRSFLQVSTGWFLHDDKLGMLQTPHHFYSPDPFERNLGNFRSVPCESELFYGIIQDTNDLWNATFFCGSCAVLRRTGLAEVGGIACETVTEDAHTSLRLQKLGWNTAYINLPQAAGLATETMADHVKQRVRWARGMAQILRVDNPLFARGLTFPQRLCYLNAMLHFLYALPRLIFLTAPILYLVFGKLNIPGYWLAILAFAVPHLVIANIINSRIQGHKRYSFWNEIYETVLSPYILLPTLFALISPKFGKFNVTAKGQNVDEDSFDSVLARPFLWLVGLNLLALCMAVPRYLYWDAGHAGTVAMNVLWTVFNLVVLTVALSACCETKQRRKAVRVDTILPIEVRFNDIAFAGMLRNISVGGGEAFVDASSSWKRGDRVRIAFMADPMESVASAHVVETTKGVTRFAFDITSLEEQETITRVVYLASDRWLDWTDGRPENSILGSLAAVLMASLMGLRKFAKLGGGRGRGKVSGMPVLARTIGVILLAVAALLLASKMAKGESVAHASEIAPLVEVSVPFRGLGAQNGILLDSSNRNQSIEIALPDNVLVQKASLKLKYTLPPSSNSTSTLDVLLNDMLLAAITPTPNELISGQGEALVPLPAEEMVRQNRITLQLANTTGAACNVISTPKSPIQIDAASEILLTEQRLVLANDLSLLPVPFSQHSSNQASNIPVVFGHTPGRTTLQAAGVLASWFGAQAVQGQSHFAVSVGTLPVGNAVVLLLDGEQVGGILPGESGLAQVRTIPNPIDPYSKLLVLSAASEDDLLRLSQALASGDLNLAGQSAALSTFKLPPQRLPDDAPRWIHTRRVSLEQMAGTDHVGTAGDTPVNFYLRFAPDYNFGVRREMYLHLAYADSARELDSKSNIVVRLNGAPAKSVALNVGGDLNRMHQVNIPLGDLPSSSFGNTLQTQFYFVPPAGQECEPNHFKGLMAGGSFLDLGAASHLARLPDLHLFSNAGFPFTRRADLSDTAILLPDNPSPALVAEYLDLLAYFGTSTGFPALRVTLGDLASAQTFASKDLLVLGTYSDLAQAPELSRQLPLQVAGSEWRLSARARWVRWFGGLAHTLRTGSNASSALEDGELAPAGVIESIESPYRSGGTVVVLLAKDSVAVNSMREGLAFELPHEGIHGSASLWQGGHFVSYDLSTAIYHVGQVSMIERLALILPEYPWILTGSLLCLSILLALWMQISLRQRIAERLMGTPQLVENPSSGGAH